MNRVLPTAVAACVLFGSSGCSNVLTRRPPPPSDERVADSVLAANVNHALRAAGVDGYAAVQIQATGGAVTLEGSLASRRMVDLAVRTAADVEGVERVVNRLSAREETEGNENAKEKEKEKETE